MFSVKHVCYVEVVIVVGLEDQLLSVRPVSYVEVVIVVGFGGPVA